MTAATPLVGLRVHLQRTIDVPCSACGETVVAIGPGAGPHVASLHCATCDRHRGWLPKAVVGFLIDLVSRFDSPLEPIIIRNSATTEFAQVAQMEAAPSGASAAPTTAP